MKRTVLVPNQNLRIISLVPSQTELLFDLGLENEVVGITKFCIHPAEWFKNKQRIGGTKNVDIDKVRSLRPNLIIGNKEENSKADIEELEKIAPVWMSDIYNLQDALDMIREIGSITNKIVESTSISTKILLEFDSLKMNANTRSCAYFIWKDPYYLSGKETFIDDMLHKIGLINYTNENRYPEYSMKNGKNPDVILLSSEPYPFKEKEIKEFKENYPTSCVLLVDGEMFSWYGSRLRLAPSYFKELQNQIKDYFELKA